MTDDLYYRKLENTSTTDLVDMIREKDKSIAELEEKLEQTEKGLADYQFNYPTIKELEKENAELKDDNKVMADNYSRMEQKFYDNITKAKEIIKSFINYYLDNYNDYTMPRFERIKEAKEFVKKQNNCEVK